MTREKKELIKQLRAINEAENLELSIGPLSPAAFNAVIDEYDERKKPLLLRLNELMHGRLNDYVGACIVNEEGESRMHSVQEVCDLLAENARQAQVVIDNTKKVLEGWDIDKAIAEGKREVELLKAGYKPSQVLEMMKEE